MKVLPLVQHGVATSRLVLGCMPFGGSWDSADPITDEHVATARKAVEAARDIGITMFDHADIYTRGKAERIFGMLLKEQPDLREQIVIQTKCGIRFPEGDVPTRFDFSSEHILQSVDGSLERLGTDYLDVLLLHRPDALVEPDEVAEAFGRLKASGKVRFFGVSNMSVGQIKFLQQALGDRLVVNQLEMSLLKLDWVDQGIHVNQRAGVDVNFADGLMEYMQMERIQIQAWGPLAQGRFSGRTLKAEEPERVRKTAAMVQEMAEAKGTQPEAIVLGWLMRHPSMIQPVIGTTNADRIRACADAETVAANMTRDEWYSLYVSSRGAPMP